MRNCLTVLWTVCCCGLLLADPLKGIPSEATLVLKVEKPRELVEAFTSLPLYQDYATLPQIKEVLDSTSAKRFFQMIKHIEAKLGTRWPQLLDRIAGKGIALATDVAKEKAPFLLVLEGTDAAQSAKAWDLLLDILAEEVGRQNNLDGPLPIERKETDGVRHVEFGDEFATFQSGAFVVLSNQKPAAKASLKLLKGQGEPLLSRKAVTKTKALLGGNPLAWLWYDLDSAKQSQAAKDFFESTRKEVLQTVVVGSSVDAVRRADSLGLGFYKTAEGLKLSLKLPAKRADLPPEFALHAPMTADVPGSLPFLEPPGTLYTQSFYLDIGTFWTQRKKLLNPELLTAFEKGERDVSKFFPGTTLGKLLEMSGPHHRFLAVERGQNQYKTVPEFPLPEMALVSSMRNAEFGKKMNLTLRTVAALVSLNYSMTMSEETIGAVEIVSYRFSETKQYTEDSTNIRYNFVPCFAVVNDSLIIATSPKLLKDLIPELKTPIDRSKCSPAVWRNRLDGDGFSTAVMARPERFITSAVLNNGIGLAEAKREVDQLVALLKRVGTIGIALDHTAEAYVVDLNWKLKE